MCTSTTKKSIQTSASPTKNMQQQPFLVDSQSMESSILSSPNNRQQQPQQQQLSLSPSTGKKKKVVSSSYSIVRVVFVGILLLLILVPIVAFAIVQTLSKFANAHEALHVPVATSSRSTNPMMISSETNNNLENAENLIIETLQHSSDSSSSSVLPKNVHVVILVHGILGNSKELSYLEQTLQNSSISTTSNRPSTTNNDEQWIIHSATCNVGRTLDGIELGGHRLAIEINELLDKLKQQYENTNQSQPTITLSIVGHSLGGLYSRYALSEINFANDIIPAVFCTSATPHLGVSENTYIKIPRIVESGVASTLQRSGADLFRFTNLLDQMITDPKFVTPLQNFRHRRAYANAYSTDFQVPFRTAAFLSNTDSIHHYKSIISNTSESSSAEKFVSLIVETDKRDLPVVSSDSVDNTEESKLDDPQPLSLDEMAQRLDALGWTKIFCDMRDNLLSFPNPVSKITGSWSKFSSSFFQKQQDTEETTTNTCLVDAEKEQQEPLTAEEPVQTVKTTICTPTTKQSFTASELLAQYSSDDNDRWHLPFGHSVLVANSKSDWYGEMNSGGRPMVERIATDLTQQIIQQVHIQEE